jgi:hypothetical protein
MKEEYDDLFEKENDIKEDLESIYKLLSLIDPNKENFASALNAIEDVNIKDEQDTVIQQKSLKRTTKADYLPYGSDDN